MFKRLFQNQKRKISIVLVQLLVLAMLSLWVLSVNRSSDLLVKRMEVHVDEVTGERNIISTAEMKSFLEKKMGDDIYQVSISSIPLEKIEELVRKDTRVHRAEVFVDAHQKMIVDIVQRRPVARVKDELGNDYYLDQDANYISTSSYGSSRVVILSGHLENFGPADEIGTRYKLNKVFSVLEEIRKDEFLKSLVEQIHSEKGERIIIIPKIGDEKIIIDYIEELPEKLRRLKIFYQEMAKKNSWGKYDEIDISYKNQIVGRNLVNP